MKVRNLFFAVLASAAVLVGCQEKDVDYGAPSITVSPSALEFDTAKGEKVITLNATRDWRLKDADKLPDWITVDPVSGGASLEAQTITVSVLENKETNREQSLTFTIGLDSKTVTVSQKGEGGAVSTGDGTLESPYTVAGALAFIETLGADISSGEVYVKGVITKFKGDVAADITKYGSISYYISDDGTEASELLVYGGRNLGGVKFTSADQLKAGDEVIVYGTLVNYKGNTPEFNNGNKLVSLNGKVEEPVDPGEFTVTPISTILAMSEGAKIEDGIGIEGVIISNSDLNNLTSQKGAYIQDATGGIQLRFTANHTFKFGDKVQINLSGVAKGSYNNAVQIEVDNAMATKVSSGENVEPKTVAIADFLANKYEGQYVAINDCQVVLDDLTKTFVVGSNHTSINFEDKDGNKFIVFSSKYSSFGAETVPQGAGVLKGIATRNNDDIQIIFAQASDYAGLTGARFGNSNVFSVSTTSINVSADAESATFKVNGNVAWTASVTEGDFVNILSGESGNGAGDVVLELTKNESTEAARTAKITVTTTADVATKSYEVVLTQAKKVGEVEGGEVTISTTSSNSWTSDKHSVYGDGRKTTSEGFDVAFYKYNSTTANADAQLQNTHIRVYKNNALVINSTDNKVIKSVIFTCAYADKCFDMTVMSDNNSIAKADTAAKTITWNGTTGITSFEAELTGGQCRISSIKIIYE